MTADILIKTKPIARFVTGSALFTRWRDDVRSGTGPVLYRHAFPYPEIGPGLVTLIGGPPGEGKTSFTSSIVTDGMRFQPELNVLVASCEMTPESFLNRQLARLSGIDADLVRRRQLGLEHEERLEAGLATLETIVNRLTFMNAPFDVGNVAASADACHADIVVIDYVQRFSVPGEDAEARHRVNRTMDYLRQFANEGIAVIVVSAVGRSRDKAGRSSYAGDGLSLASFRETSELEYGADDALILARVNENDPEIVRLSHFKARHGCQVNQEFRFNRAVQSFTLLSGDKEVERASAKGSKYAARPTTRASVTEELLRLWEGGAAADDDSPAPETPAGVGDE